MGFFQLSLVSFGVMRAEPQQMALEALPWLVFPSSLAMFRPVYAQMQQESVTARCVERGDQKEVHCVTRGEQIPR